MDDRPDSYDDMKGGEVAAPVRRFRVSPSCHHIVRDVI